jgi:NitT/TauT family transport system substrate-binding protein
MSWLPSSEYAGIIVALHNGEYSKRHIDCSIEPGGVGLNSIQLVASGADDFGLAGGDSLLVARSRGIPVEAFATEFHVSPQVFFARTSSGIKTPQQFPGHSVGIKVGKTAETLYHALVGKLGIDTTNIHEVPVKAGMQQFFAGQVDVWPGFIFDEAEDARAQGIPINLIQPSDYGIVLYSDVIFAADMTIQEKPDLVRRLLAATQAGWAWTQEHPDEALKIVLSTYRDLDPAHEKTRLSGAIPLIVGSTGHRVHPIGRMDPMVWDAMYRMLDSQHLLKDSFPVTSAYTTKFLKDGS